MKSKDFLALAKQLLRNLPGFSLKGPMMVLIPVKSVLRGIYFESSSFDTKSFYVWVFFLPLFVPTTNVRFNLGKRIRVSSGGDRWSTDMSNLTENLALAIEKEALPFLHDIESTLDIVKVLEKTQTPNDPYVRQAIAYSWAKAEDRSKAIGELDRLEQLLDVKVEWQRVMHESAKGLKAKLMENEMIVRNQLEFWESESFKNLGLEKLK